MEDKRTAIAVLLCMFLLMFWMEWVMAPYNRRPLPNNNPNQTAPATSQTSNQQPSANGAQAVNTNSGQTGAVAVPATAHPNPAQLKTAGSVIIESENLLVTVTNLGARLSSVQLKKFNAFLGSKALLDLVRTKESASLPLGILAGNINDEFVEYHLKEFTQGSKLENGNYFVKSGAPAQFTFVGSHPSGIEFTKTLKFNSDSYVIDIDIALSKPAPDGSSIWLEWTHFDADHASNQRLNHNSYTVLGDNNKVRLLQLTEVVPPVMELGHSLWASFGDKYFMATLIAPAGGADTRVGQESDVFFTRLSSSDKSGAYHLFVGPKTHGDLATTGYQLERNVDLGWFAFVAHPLLGAINFFYKLLGNYGLAIILLTLLIKAAFLPLTKTSFQSMRAMQALQPEMKALRERIQDPNQLNKEIMALYKKHGVNPMGGCLPMLIQLPVFLGLYNALNYSIELRHAPFALWINDLSSPEKLEVLGIGIPVMVLMMGASMLIQQLTTPSAADPQQKKIMLMMPIIFTFSFVIFPFPSGLVLYWLVNNLISIIQQMNLRGKGNSGTLQGTIIASLIIFGIGYVLTLL